MTSQSYPKLSICIATFNRASFIGATLDSITSQATPECEVIVSDNASTDGTGEVVCERARRFEQLRYVRQDVNRGLDCNFDRAIEAARGEYCWLMSDDDLLKPGAIERVLTALRQEPSLLLVNMEYRDFTMSKVLQARKFEFLADRIYGPHELDQLFIDIDDGLWYIGSVILRRSIWLARERERYYGSLFVHVAVIFQKKLPGNTIVIAEPLVSYRMGNATSYSSDKIEILFQKWPALIESLELSASATKKVRSAQPWGSPKWLLLLRGWGMYSLTEYRRWVRPRLRSNAARSVLFMIALIPGVLANTLLTLYYSLHPNRGREVQWLRRSRFHILKWRLFKTVGNQLPEGERSK